MSRERSKGKVMSFRIHRVRGFGPPSDHIPVHAVVELDDGSDRRMGFPLQDDGDELVHQAWVGMLRDAVAHDITVEVLADHETERGHNGVIRDLTLLP